MKLLRFHLLADVLTVSLKMPALDGMTGIVFGAVVGSLFVITCIISAVKAVRDRSRIKTRIAEKKKERLKNGYTDEKKNADIEESQSSSCYSKQRLQHLRTDGVGFSNDRSGRRNSMEHLDLSIYSIQTGVDNLTFKYSNSDIKYADGINRDSSQLPHTSVESVPLSKCANLNSENVRNEINLNHLPTDCLAIQKNIRRHSYEIAVCENSWLPIEPHGFAKSQTKVNTYIYDGGRHNVVKSSKVSFENRAYDKDDFAKA